jgi:N-acetyl-anhydromuramyl-L-alanine amidase AmpD
LKPMHSRLASALCVAIATLATAPLSNPAFAAKPSNLQSTNVDALVAAQNAAMAKERKQYVTYFQAAYQRYPQIPSGVLESVAYVRTRWNHVVPDVSDASLHADHGHMAPAYGVMALFAGTAGFQNQVDQAAMLLGVSPYDVKTDASTNIMGAAALLARDIDKLGKTRPAPEEIAGILANTLGTASVKSSRIDKHIAESYAYDVLHILDQGADDHGIRIKARPIEFEKAFSLSTLATQKASFVRLDVSMDRIETADYAIDPISETLVGRSTALAKSTDYGPALYQQSPNENARTANPTHVTIHQMEGFYAGSIATFLQVGGVAAHYLIRNSDGQVTQMVRESRAGAHVFRNNNYTIGIEQEGFKGQSNWYSDANYREVIAITKNICARWSIPCSSVYRGTATDTENIQATSLRIKGHQHFPDQGGNRSDPGRFFNWTRFADGISGTSTPGVLDGFESSEGRFASDPTASGSTVGISTSSTAERNDVRVRPGSGTWSEQIGLIDSTATSADWDVRFLSGGGAPAQNASLQKAGGRLGFWAFTAAPGVSVQMAVDDSDGTERSIAKTLSANTWTFFEWKLDDQAEWDAWVGGNGTITAASVTLDSIWFKRVQNDNPVYIYFDDVSFRVQ